MARLKKRQKEIFNALVELGHATARQIATKTDLDVNGVMQTLNNSKSLGGRIQFEGKEYVLRIRWKEEKGSNPDIVIWYLVEK